MKEIAAGAIPPMKTAIGSSTHSTSDVVADQQDQPAADHEPGDRAQLSARTNV